MRDFLCLHAIIFSRYPLPPLPAPGLYDGNCHGYVHFVTLERMPAWFYILRLRSGRLYCGATKDIQRRMGEHSVKKACRTTTSDPIDALVYSETYKTYSEALKREAEVKRWPRKKKEALIAGNTDTG